MERGEGISDSLSYCYGDSLILDAISYGSSEGGFSSFEGVFLWFYGILMVSFIIFFAARRTGFFSSAD